MKFDEFETKLCAEGPGDNVVVVEGLYFVRNRDSSIVTQRIERERQNVELPVNDLARTDDPSKGEKEQPPFLPPATSQ